MFKISIFLYFLNFLMIRHTNFTVNFFTVIFVFIYLKIDLKKKFKFKFIEISKAVTFIDSFLSAKFVTSIS